MYLQERMRASKAALVKACLYVGMVGYGGPVAIALMKELFVGKRGWVDEGNFVDGLGLSQMVPGAISVNLAAYLGYGLQGIPGAIAAPLFFVLPAYFLITLLSALYAKYGDVHIVTFVFSGLGAVVVGLTAKAAISIGKTAIRDYSAGVIALFAAVAVGLYKVPILWEVVGTGSLGLIIYGLVGLGGPRGSGSGKHRDHYPHRPGRMAPSPGSLALALTGIIAGVVLFSIAAGLGKMAVVFIRMGFMTFGGGYAAIPVIQGEVVDKLHWISVQEFKDGIILGQVTPGPVLITATFVGYRVAGVLGSLVATACMFLPPFVMTLALSDRHAAFKENPRVQGAIRGIVAGFAGVLVTVVIRFAATSLTDVRTVTIGICSIIALIILNAETLVVILGGVLLSIVWKLLT